MKKFSSITRANSRHTSQAKKIRLIVLFGIIGCVLIFVVPKIVAFAAALVMTPIHATQTWLTQSADSFPQFVRDRSELIKQIDILNSEKSSQGGDRLTISLLSQENVELRKLLSNDGKKRILAGVIGRPNTLPYDVIVLDKGSDDGLVEGAPVYIADSAVIGVIGKVFQKSSVVELITTPGFISSVYILGPNIYTNAEGVGGGQMRVGVPQGITLSVGDLVVLPGVSSGIYGAISVIDSVPTEPQQYGYVSPEVPLAGLHFVSVGEMPLKAVTFEEAEKIVAEVKKDLFTVPVPEHILVTTGTSTASTTPKASTSTTP